MVGFARGRGSTKLNTGITRRVLLYPIPTTSRMVQRPAFDVINNAFQASGKPITDDPMHLKHQKAVVELSWESDDIGKNIVLNGRESRTFPSFGPSQIFI